MRPSAPSTISELHEGRQQDRDGVGVDLVFAVEVRGAGRRADDDHDVPDRRRERWDREVFVGLQDPHQQAGESQQQHDGEQHLGEPDGEQSPTMARTSAR